MEVTGGRGGRVLREGDGRGRRGRRGRERERGREKIDKRSSRRVTTGEKVTFWFGLVGGYNVRRGGRKEGGSGNRRKMFGWWLNCGERGRD